MHPTSMANNNYSVHEQEIILGSKSFTLGTPYTQQHELIEENVNTTTTAAINDEYHQQKGKANVAKNAVGGKQMQSKAQQQKIVDKPLRRRKTRYWRLIKSWQITLKISAHLVTWSTMMPKNSSKFRKQMVSINTSTCNKSKLCRKETTE